MKVWITQYALTRGILEAEGELNENAPEMIVCKSTGVFEGVPFPYFHGEGKEWHRTEAEAKVRANQMVQDKIKSLKKQLTKLEALKNAF